MKKIPILIVEDDPKYHARYKRWLGESTFKFDTALNTAEAKRLISERYYALIILDLSLEPENPHDRSSIEVQNFIKGDPDKTLHIVVSGHAQTPDAVNAAYEKDAFYLIEKKTFETNSDLLVQKVNDAVEKHLKDLKKSSFSDRYYKLLLNDHTQIWETKAANILNPLSFEFQGEFFYKLIKDIAPFARHNTKNSIEIMEDSNALVGLIWSKLLGKPISFVIFNEKNEYSEEQGHGILSRWLGWQPGDHLESVSHKGLKAYIYNEEININSKEFLIRK